MTTNIIYKNCSFCKESLPLEKFAPEKKGYLSRRANCRECFNKKRRESSITTFEHLPMLAVKRFLSHINKTEKCWIWTGSTDKNGYGRLPVGYAMMLAHRFSFLYHNKKINPKLGVLHECDNPPCVNPAHLFEGTQQNNMDDMLSKGRSRKGEQHGGSKLKNYQVRVIKQLLKRKVTQTAIALLYDVNPSTISDIHTGKMWTHIE